MRTNHADAHTTVHRIIESKSGVFVLPVGLSHGVVVGYCPYCGTASPMMHGIIQLFHALFLEARYHAFCHIESVAGAQPSRAGFMRAMAW